MPDHWLGRATVAAAYGQLGDSGAAAKALREMLALRADSAAIARQEIAKVLDAEFTEHLIDGLRKAALEISG